MTQYLEHYTCGRAPCAKAIPPLSIEAWDYILGVSPPRYPVPAPILDVEWSSTKGPHVWRLFYGDAKPVWACVIPTTYYWG